MLIGGTQLLEDHVAPSIRFIFKPEGKLLVVARVHGHEDCVDVLISGKPISMGIGAVRNEGVTLVDTQAEQPMAPFTVVVASWRPRRERSLIVAACDPNSHHVTRYGRHGESKLVTASGTRSASSGGRRVATKQQCDQRYRAYKLQANLEW